MSINRAIAFGALLSLFAMGYGRADAMEETSLVTKRDLARYDKAGPYTTYPFKSQNDTESRIRDFLWEHYTGKRRGCLIVVRHTKEGEPFTYHIFIEPDRNGVWRFRLTVDGIKAAGPYSGPNTPFDRIHWEYETCAVAREDPPSGEVEQSDPRANEKSNPQTHQLVLKYCGGGDVVF